MIFLLYKTFPCFDRFPFGDGKKMKYYILALFWEIIPYTFLFRQCRIFFLLLNESKTWSSDFSYRFSSRKWLETDAILCSELTKIHTFLLCGTVSFSIFIELRFLFCWEEAHSEPPNTNLVWFLKIECYLRLCGYAKSDALSYSWFLLFHLLFVGFSYFISCQKELSF